MTCGCGKSDGACADGAKPAQDESDTACSGSESFALQVLGNDMAPEFDDGDIIIIEPDGRLGDGSYVLARVAEEWLFRQLCRDGAGWELRALNPGTGACAVLPIPDLSVVRGVVIQKAVPGRRRASKFYV